MAARERSATVSNPAMEQRRPHSSALDIDPTTNPYSPHYIPRERPVLPGSVGVAQNGGNSTEKQRTRLRTRNRSSTVAGTVDQDDAQPATSRLRKMTSGIFSSKGQTIEYESRRRSTVMETVMRPVKSFQNLRTKFRSSVTTNDGDDEAEDGNESDASDRTITARVPAEVAVGATSAEREDRGPEPESHGARSGFHGARTREARPRSSFFNNDSTTAQHSAGTESKRACRILDTLLNPRSSLGNLLSSRRSTAADGIDMSDAQQAAFIDSLQYVQTRPDPEDDPNASVYRAGNLVQGVPYESTTAQQRPLHYTPSRSDAVPIERMTEYEQKHLSLDRDASPRRDTKVDEDAAADKASRRVQARGSDAGGRGQRDRSQTVAGSRPMTVCTNAEAEQQQPQRRSALPMLGGRLSIYQEFTQHAAHHEDGVSPRTTDAPTRRRAGFENSALTSITDPKRHSSVVFATEYQALLSPHEASIWPYGRSEVRAAPDDPADLGVLPEPSPEEDEEDAASVRIARAVPLPRATMGRKVSLEPPGMYTSMRSHPPDGFAERPGSSSTSVNASLQKPGRSHHCHSCGHSVPQESAAKVPVQSMSAAFIRPAPEPISGALRAKHSVLQTAAALRRSLSTSSIGTLQELAAESTSLQSAGAPRQIASTSSIPPAPAPAELAGTPPPSLRRSISTSAYSTRSTFSSSGFSTHGTASVPKMEAFLDRHFNMDFNVDTATARNLDVGGSREVARQRGVRKWVGAQRR